MTLFNRILVATDFSPCSDAALDYGIELASTCHATLAVVHVFEDPYVPAAYWEVYGAMPPEQRASMMSDIEARLAERRRRADVKGVTVISNVLTGRTAKAITDYATAHDTDLIVMGTHGRTGLGHLLMGSVAESVVRQAGCPVLTVRESRVPEAPAEIVAAIANGAVAGVAMPW